LKRIETIIFNALFAIACSETFDTSGTIQSALADSIAILNGPVMDNHVGVGWFASTGASPML
jgi:hypothetical protein